MLRERTAALKEEYGSSVIPLKDIARKYLGMAERRAVELASREEIDLPVFKLEDRKKASWVVSVEDLARQIERKRKQAQEAQARRARAKKVRRTSRRLKTSMNR